MRYYTPCTIDKNGTIAETIAYLLLNNVWKLHGLLLSLIFDRGFQFISGVCKNLSKIFSFKANLSISFYLETDGQIKIDD